MGLGSIVLVALGAIAVLILLASIVYDERTTEYERPVLPSHYSSLLYTDPSHYPGHCTSCGTDNEPGYRFCEECGERIPTSHDYSDRSDVSTIFGE